MTADTIEAKAEAAMTHEASRLEAVCRAVARYCGGYPQAMERSRLEKHWRDGARLVYLDGVVVWRGGWQFPGFNDDLPSDTQIHWREEWTDACPADIRATEEAERTL